MLAPTALRVHDCVRSLCKCTALKKERVRTTVSPSYSFLVFIQETKKHVERNILFFSSTHTKTAGLEGRCRHTSQCVWHTILARRCTRTSYTFTLSVFKEVERRVGTSGKRKTEAFPFHRQPPPPLPRRLSPTTVHAHPFRTLPSLCCLLFGTCTLTTHD